MDREHRLFRFLCFWGAVGGVSIISNIGIEVLARRNANPGLRRLVALAHYGTGPGGSES